MTLGAHEAIFYFFSELYYNLWYITVRRVKEFILSLVHAILFRTVHDINANFIAKHVNSNDG